MKRFVLSCCILAATSTMVFAQAAKSNATKSNKGQAVATKQSTSPVKADFLTKANDFETGVSHGNTALAQQRFEDLKQIITVDLHSIKPKIVNATSQAEKNKWMDIMNKKQDIYYAIINAASDIKTNGQVMVKKYKEYAATL